mmetsp:Transcript_14250/g.41814  ORF Transcript_14250/g.41814 Transcript_14250/m.41814 type:complete len:88 (+) Transcript_14250:915-1178(+)
MIPPSTARRRDEPPDGDGGPAARGWRRTRPGDGGVVAGGMKKGCGEVNDASAKRERAADRTITDGRRMLERRWPRDVPMGTAIVDHG